METYVGIVRWFGILYLPFRVAYRKTKQANGSLEMIKSGAPQLPAYRKAK